MKASAFKQSNLFIQHQNDGRGKSTSSPKWVSKGVIVCGYDPTSFTKNTSEPWAKCGSTTSSVILGIKSMQKLGTLHSKWLDLQNTQDCVYFLHTVALRIAGSTSSKYRSSPSPAASSSDIMSPTSNESPPSYLWIQSIRLRLKAERRLANFYKYTIVNFRANIYIFTIDEHLRRLFLKQDAGRCRILFYDAEHPSCSRTSWQSFYERSPVSAFGTISRWWWRRHTICETHLDYVLHRTEGPSQTTNCWHSCERSYPPTSKKKVSNYFTAKFKWLINITFRSLRASRCSKVKPPDDPSWGGLWLCWAASVSFKVSTWSCK